MDKEFMVDHVDGSVFKQGMLEADFEANGLDDALAQVADKEDDDEELSREDHEKVDPFGDGETPAVNDFAFSFDDCEVTVNHMDKEAIRFSGITPEFAFPYVKDHGKGCWANEAEDKARWADEPAEHPDADEALEAQFDDCAGSRQACRSRCLDDISKFLENLVAECRTKLRVCRADVARADAFTLNALAKFETGG